MKRAFLATLLVTMIAMSACVRPADPTVTPAPTHSGKVAVAPTSAPSGTPVPEAEPGVTPTLTAIPTAAEVAPEETFTKVGQVALLEGEHGVAGKAMVAGLQTLIIQGFSFDGKGSPADVRLVKKDSPEEATHILLELESRPYESEVHVLTIPSSVGPRSADSIAVFCPETGDVYAIAEFE